MVHVVPVQHSAHNRQYILDTPPKKENPFLMTFAIPYWNILTKNTSTMFESEMANYGINDEPEEAVHIQISATAPPQALATTSLLIDVIFNSYTVHNTMGKGWYYHSHLNFS